MILENMAFLMAHVGLSENRGLLYVLNCIDILECKGIQQTRIFLGVSEKGDVSRNRGGNGNIIETSMYTYWR